MQHVAIAGQHGIDAKLGNWVLGEDFDNSAAGQESIGNDIQLAADASPWVTVKRTDLNMGKYAPYVGDDVTIDVAIEAIKQ